MLSMFMKFLMLIILIAIFSSIIVTTIFPSLSGEIGLTRQNTFSILCYKWKNDYNCDTNMYEIIETEDGEDTLEGICERFYQEEGCYVDDFADEEYYSGSYTCSKLRCIKICRNDCI